MLRFLIAVVYLAIGLVVASNNNYLSNLNELSAIISALLAVLLWPLVLLGVGLLWSSSLGHCSSSASPHSSERIHRSRCCR